MLIKLLGIEDNPLAIFLVLATGGLLSYFLISGLSHQAIALVGVCGVRTRLRPRQHPERTTACCTACPG
jgi:hypothetical protein